MKKTVKCKQCMHLIEKEDAQEIPVDDRETGKTTVYYYCPEHRRNFDRIVNDGGYLGAVSFYKNVEVNPQGYVRWESCIDCLRSKSEEHSGNHTIAVSVFVGVVCLVAGVFAGIVVTGFLV